MINALKPLTLLLFLTACASDPVVQTRTEYRYPPSALLRPCPVPAYTGTKWVDVSQYAILLQARLEQCNADKTEMRALSE